MATGRLSRRQIRAILRWKGVLGLRHLEVAQSLRVGYRREGYTHVPMPARGGRGGEGRVGGPTTQSVRS
jgi:hypothetical protein